MKVNRWLLPEGVEEILPDDAQTLEQLRRRLLDLYINWGYELVIPPFMEFTDSLLDGLGSDLNLLTLKVTDQLSGKLMGLRADMTPQVARIDAHSYVKTGPNRLCYAGHVFHTKPRSPLAVRTPLQAGIELFGEPGLNADIEVISLLLSSMEQIGIKEVTLDLGHVGLCRSLLETLKLTSDQKNTYFDLLQTKDGPGIIDWVNATPISSQDGGNWLMALPGLCGDKSILELARVQLSGASDEIILAIDELTDVYQIIHSRYPEVKVYFDLGEFRGYHYHTGIVFAAYTDGFGDAIANGGRYDHIGQAYGRARSATGFGLNLTSISSLLSPEPPVSGIYAPPSDDPLQWQAIQQLRELGERVVCGLSQLPDFQELRCDRQLVLEASGEYRVQLLSS